MAPTTRFSKALASASVALIAAAGLSGCGSDDTLAVCTSIPFEPFQYKDSWQDNKVVGFDVDMMNLVAEKLGKTQRIVETGFGPITSGQALEDGDCDIAAAALSITPEREKVMDFSQPYYHAEQARAVLPGTGVKDLGDLDGKVLGIQLETTGADYATEHQKESGYEIKTYPDFGKLREAVEYEKIDAALGDVPLWLRESTEHPDYLRIAERYDTGEQYGYAVAKGNKDLLETINDVIDSAKRDGTFADIYLKWIGERYEGH